MFYVLYIERDSYGVQCITLYNGNHLHFIFYIPMLYMLTPIIYLLLVCHNTNHFNNFFIKSRYLHKTKLYFYDVLRFQ